MASSRHVRLHQLLQALAEVDGHVRQVHRRSVPQEHSHGRHMIADRRVVQRARILVVSHIRRKAGVDQQTDHIRAVPLRRDEHRRRLRAKLGVLKQQFVDACTIEPHRRIDE